MILPLKLTVITPFGPGHEAFARQAVNSVVAAMAVSQGPFAEVQHILVDDSKGLRGRSAARNHGMDLDAGWADWFFFLDADDTMDPLALTRLVPSAPATFGLVYWNGALDGRARRLNVFPCGWREVAIYGARGTLSMGFFVDAKVARDLRFSEAMNIAEDYDFYMRLPGFVKVYEPLARIGYYLPSAGGPRGYDEVDWVGSSNKVIAAAVAKEPSKYDLGDYAVLAKARRTPRQRRALLANLQRP